MTTPAPAIARVQLLRERDAADMLGMCSRSLRKLRQDGVIDFVLIGGSIRYSMVDLTRFIDERRTRCVSIKGQGHPTGGSTGAPPAVSDIAAARAKRESAKRESKPSG